MEHCGKERYVPLAPYKRKDVADVENGKEYRNKTITRLFGGNARNGCYFLAFMIFSAGMVRDNLFVLFSSSPILVSFPPFFPRLYFLPFPPPYSSLTNFDPKRTGTTKHSSTNPTRPSSQNHTPHWSPRCCSSSARPSSLVRRGL